LYQVYSLEKSDKSKTGNDGFVQKRDFMNETHWIFIGLLPVMVKSNLCLLHKFERVKHAIIKFGRVKLEKPVFWTGKDEGSVDFKPWHARLQNMTYASRLRVEVNIQILTIFILLHAHYLFFIYAMFSQKKRATWVNYKISDDEKKFTKMLEYEWHDPMLFIVDNTKFSPFLIS